VRDFTFGDMPDLEAELMESPDFLLGFKCGMLFSGSSFMAMGVLREHGWYALKAIVPTRGAAVMLRIADKNGVLVHSHEIDDESMQVCFLDPEVLN
jgi:hypothetical protein